MLYVNGGVCESVKPAKAPPLNCIENQSQFWEARRMKTFVSVSVICLLLCAANRAAGETITLATSENQPYIGEQLDQNGYVYELAAEIFPARRL